MTDLDLLLNLNQGANNRNTRAWLPLIQGAALFDALNQSMREDALLDALRRSIKNVDFFNAQCQLIKERCFHSRFADRMKYSLAAIEKSLLSFASLQTPPLMEEGNLKSVWLPEKLNLVRGLFQCAALAVKNPDFSPDDIDSVASEIFGDKTEPSRQLMWGCVRTFLKAHVRRRAVTNVALVNTSGKEGFLARFEAEVIEGGDQLFHHPSDWIASYFDGDFLNSIETAWLKARELAGSEGANIDCSARWRLVGLDGVPISSVSGRSASGAAGFAFYHALKSTVPDSEIIVLAQFDKDGNLEGVDSVEEKTRAIAASNLIDKIVVATRANEDEARETLRECRKLGQIIVELIDGE
jgi:hypothetical protein